MAFHRLQGVEGVRLAVVVVAGAQDLVVEPGRVGLVAHGGPAQLALELVGPVGAEVGAGAGEELAGAEPRGVGHEGVEGGLVEEPHEARAGRIEGAGLALEEGEDAVLGVADSVRRLASGPEVAHGRGMVEARGEGLVEVDVPGQIVGVIAAAGVAPGVDDVADGAAAAVAVAEAAAQAGAVADDGAEVAVDRLLVEAVGLEKPVLERAVGRAVGDADLVVDASRGAAEDAQVAAGGAERASLEGPGHAGSAVGGSPLGENLDDGADGVGAVEGGLGAADDLDALDLAGRDAVEVEVAAVVVDPHAVDEDVVVVGLAAPGEDGGEGALAARRLDVEAGHVAQDVGDRVAAEGLDVLGGEDRVRLGDRRGALRGARGGDDDGVPDGGDVEAEVGGRGAGRRHLGRGGHEAAETGGQAIGRGFGQIQAVAPVVAGGRGRHQAEPAPRLDDGARQHAAGRVGDEPRHRRRFLGGRRRDGQREEQDGERGAIPRHG